MENICYYKDDTHYFVMTAKKSSLLDRGVLLRDYADTITLLSPENINRAKLLGYAKDAATWTTNNGKFDEITCISLINVFIHRFGCGKVCVESLWRTRRFND